MSEKNGLCLAKMRVTRNHHVLIGFCEIHEFPLQVPDLNLHLDDGALQVETRVQGHLIVPAASCVQLEASIANRFNQARLDEAVNILCVLTRQPTGLLLDALLDFCQAPANFFELFLRQNAGFRQNASVGERSLDVFENEPLVDAKRVVEPLEDCVDLFGKSAAPGFHE